MLPDVKMVDNNVVQKCLAKPLYSDCFMVAYTIRTHIAIVDANTSAMKPVFSMTGSIIGWSSYSVVIKQIDVEVIMAKTTTPQTVDTGLLDWSTFVPASYKAIKVLINLVSSRYANFFNEIRTVWRILIINK